MKSNIFLFKHYPALLVFLILFGLILISWDHKQTADPFRKGHYVNDTIPKEKKIRNLDEALQGLNEIDLKINMEKVQKEIAEAIKNIDKAKIKLEVEKALKNIDVEKIKAEVENSIAKINWEKIREEIDEVKKVDMKKLEKEMEKVNEKLKNLGPEIEREMEKAKVEIEKAKSEIKEYKDFIDGLENEGLLNKKENYTIIHKDGELIVNGEKATEQVYSKYRSFLEKHKNFKIRKNDDDFNIDKD